MSISIDPHFNDPLQRLILIDSSSGELAIDLISSIEPEPIEDHNSLTATIIETGFGLAEGRPEAIDYLVKILLDLERKGALPHDQAQHFTNRVISLGSRNPEVTQHAHSRTS